MLPAHSGDSILSALGEDILTTSRVLPGLIAQVCGKRGSPDEGSAAGAGSPHCTHTCLLPTPTSHASQRLAKQQ